MSAPGIYYKDLHNDPDKPNLPPRPLGAIHTAPTNPDPYYARTVPVPVHSSQASRVDAISSGYDSHGANLNARHTVYGSSESAYSNTSFGGSTTTAAVPAYNTRPIYVDGVLEGQYQPGMVNGMVAAPTESHALAVESQPVKGAAQRQMGNNIKDLGWNEPAELIAAPLVGGLQNEDLWILIRRFNKVCIPRCSSEVKSLGLIGCIANVPRQRNDRNSTWKLGHERCRAG